MQDGHRTPAVPRQTGDIGDQLFRSADIAPGAQGVRRPFRDDVGPAACLPEKLGLALHECITVLVFGRRDPNDGGTGQTIEQDVAFRRRRVGRLRRSQQQAATEAQCGSCKGCGAAMVGLGPSAGDHRVGVEGQCIGHDELQFADLVAGQCSSGKIIPLDVQLDTEFPTQTPQRLNRRGQTGQIDPRWRGRFHFSHPSFKKVLKPTVSTEI